MGWPEGQPRGKKTGGRKAGTPNKRTAELFEIINKADFNAAESLISCYWTLFNLVRFYSIKAYAEKKTSYLATSTQYLRELEISNPQDINLAAARDTVLTISQRLQRMPASK